MTTSNKNHPTKKKAPDKPVARHAKKPLAKASQGEQSAPEAQTKSAAQGATSTEPANKPKLSPRTRHPLYPGTYFAKPGAISIRWRLIDAANLTLGRLSSRIAHILMGKDKPGYTRSTDTGDFVIVINAEKVRLTGRKLWDKVYQHHTNYPGGLKTITAQEILAEHPERLIEKAVYRMLPKGHMGRAWFKKLKVYSGSEHPHQAQKPEKAVLPDLGASS